MPTEEAVPIGTAVHERTFQLCESLSYRQWSGYYAVSVYETHHEHEYNAIRNSAALIDVTPLFKYRIRGKDATKFVNRVIARDILKVAAGQVIYCCWCDPQGKVVDDGTISRLAENTYRWTAADPNLRWFRQNALGRVPWCSDAACADAVWARMGRDGVVPSRAAFLRHMTAHARQQHTERVHALHRTMLAAGHADCAAAQDLLVRCTNTARDADRVWHTLITVSDGTLLESKCVCVCVAVFYRVECIANDVR